jgi:hypothetical protein
MVTGYRKREEDVGAVLSFRWANWKRISQMHVSNLLHAKNLRYAVGELFLIVIGVTIALAATSWYEGQQDRKFETEALFEIRKALQADHQSLVESQKVFQQIADGLLSLLTYLESDSPSSDEFPAYLGKMNQWREFRIRTAPFEALKEGGLSLISNDALRFKLISLYEEDYASLLASSENQRQFVVNESLPYFLDNFRRTETREWVPHDYQYIKLMGRVANMARWRAYTIDRYLLPRFARALESIEEVISLIDSQVGDEN